MQRFTVKGVERLIRAGGSHIYTEKALKGQGKLALRVRNGSAEWLFQYYADGKRRMIKLGPASGDAALALAEASTRVTPLRQQVIDGLNPKAEAERKDRERREREQEEASRGTVEQLFVEYICDMKRREKSSWGQVERALLTGQHAAVEYLGRRTKAAEVTPTDVRNVLRMAYLRGSKSMAFHLRAYLFGAFRYGIGSEHDYTRGHQNVAFGLEINPVASIPVDRRARVSGERVLTPEEIRSVWFDLPDFGATERTHMALRLMLAVGEQRVREVCMARMAEFDLEARTWTIPSERTKNRRQHTVPLTERALEIVARAFEKGKGGEFLFPGAGAVVAPLTSEALNKVVRRYCQRVGIPRWTPRDIRRTARTMLAEAGEPDHRLDRHLNHGTSLGVGQRHYDKSQHMTDKTKTMAVWDKLLSMALKEDTGKVIPLVLS